LRITKNNNKLYVNKQKKIIFMSIPTNQTTFTLNELCMYPKCREASGFLNHNPRYERVDTLRCPGCSQLFCSTHIRPHIEVHNLALSIVKEIFDKATLPTNQTNSNRSHEFCSYPECPNAILPNCICKCGEIFCQFHDENHECL